LIFYYRRKEAKRRKEEAQKEVSSDGVRVGLVPWLCYALTFWKSPTSI